MSSFLLGSKPSGAKGQAALLEPPPTHLNQDEELKGQAPSNMLDARNGSESQATDTQTSRNCKLKLIEGLAKESLRFLVKMAGSVCVFTILNIFLTADLKTNKIVKIWKKNH